MHTAHSVDFGKMAVSVVIPVYNAARYIVQTLQSFQQQTSSVAEVIIIDDHSTDDSIALCRAWAAEATMPVYIDALPPGQKGVSYARNAGVTQATQEWVLLMDADDLAAPGFVENLQRTAALNAAAGPITLFYSAYDQVDENGQLLSQPMTFQQYAPEEMLGRLLVRNFISTSGLVLHREQFLRVGGFNPAIRLSEDWDLWLRLATLENHWVYLPEPFIHVRRHPHNTSRDAQQLLGAERQVLSQYEPGVIATAIAKRHLPPAQNQADCANVMFRVGLWEEGATYLQALQNEAPQYPALYFQWGLYAAHQQDWEAALTYWHTARELGFDNAALTNNLGVVHAVLGQFEPAKRYFKAALTVVPEYQDAQWNQTVLASKVQDASQYKLTSRALRHVLTHYL